HRGRGIEAIGRPRRTGVSRLAGDHRDVRPLSGEQSNSSVVLSNVAIAKLVRQLAPGDHPDVTLPTHLRANGFDHVPGVLGTLDLDLPGESSPGAVVVVHDLVPNECDLWQWSQDVLTREVEALASDHEPTSDDAGMIAVTGLLAQRTAEMHVALSMPGPGFDPQPFTLLWQRSVLQSLRASLRETQRLLRRSRGSLAEADTEAATRLLDDGDALLLGSFERMRKEKLDVARIRIHGDYHLGQVLWTGHDVVMIDFEGEPGRSIGERSIKRSALTDVGGMMRSFDYAGRVALATSQERGRISATQVAALEGWRRRWTTRVQDHFWQSYLEGIAGAELVGGGPPLVPADAEHATLLLDGNILSKALYEVRYELAQRPSWVGWPLAAIAQLLEKS
nr:phosphotransferase [Acidimicrobiia bacterium]